MNQPRCRAVLCPCVVLWSSAVCLLPGVAAWTAAPPAPKVPTVDKTSLLVHTERQVFLDGDRQVWKWTPVIDFRVNGPIAAGSKLVVSCSLDGKPWLDLPCPVSETAADGWWATSAGSDYAALKPKAVRYTGPVGFTIKLTGPDGQATSIYTGRFSVKRIARTGSVTAEWKEAEAFYVDYDWALPFGLMTYAKSELRGNAWEPVPASPMLFYAWFVGEPSARRSPTGQLFYNGRKIDDTAEAEQSHVREALAARAYESDAHTYRCFQFWFSNVLLAARNDYQARPGVHRIWENLGDYEVRLLQDGKLVRTAQFTVGPGKPVDGGLGALLNALNFIPYEVGGGFGWTNSVKLMPLKVLDTGGVACNRDAWKTEAYFGQPIQGFAAP